MSVILNSRDANEEVLDRGGFIRRIGSIGAAVVGAIAITWKDAPVAEAAPYCCNLAHPNGPWCGGTKGTCSFSCPSGYHKVYWSCTYSRSVFSCYECAAGSTCYSGPWACSNYCHFP